MLTPPLVTMASHSAAARAIVASSAASSSRITPYERTAHPSASSSGSSITRFDSRI